LSQPLALPPGGGQDVRAIAAIAGIKPYSNQSQPQMLAVLMNQPDSASWKAAVVTGEWIATPTSLGRQSYWDEAYNLIPPARWGIEAMLNSAITSSVRVV